ncbi:MAG: translation initiation factor IF-2 [Chloroflexota bacterium]
MGENEQVIKNIELPASLSVRDLAQMIDASPIEVIKSLMANGVMANINQQIDFDTAAIVVSEFGFEATLVTPEVVREEIGEVPLWRRLIADEDVDKLVARPPVVSMLGHVDHGKTTLLDAIRHTDVAAGEAGGITQHIGAYQVEHKGRQITFLDTPGHAAFTAMRARGAQGADVVVLVVAADDGVMPQTKEAVAHAKAAQVPIVVALNKMDKSNANPERSKQQLAEINLVPDDWDGDTIVVPVSAKEKKGLDDLLEAILLVADNSDIRANPAGRVFGTVVEAEVDRARGVLATLLVQNGTLSVGDVVLAGTAYGKLRAMFDYRSRSVEEAGPSIPVSVMGINEVPRAGELFYVVPSEREARRIVVERKEAKAEAEKTKREGLTLEKFFERVQSGEEKELRLVIKADVQGSLEPIVSSLEKLSVGNIGVNILYAETGNIGENDVMLASASKAFVIGFNVEADVAARRLAETEGVSYRLYEIIYRLIEDIEKALKGMLEPEEKEVRLGRAEVLAIFQIPRIGKIAGCRVVEGVIRRNAKLKVHRKDKIIYQGEFASLKHEKDDVREIRQGFECGIGVKGFEDFEVGDTIECYIFELVSVL